MSWLGSVGKKTFKNLSNSSLEFSIGIFIGLMPMVDTVSMKYDTIYYCTGTTKQLLNLSPIDRKMGLFLPLEHSVTN